MAAAEITVVDDQYIREMTFAVPEELDIRRPREHYGNPGFFRVRQVTVKYTKWSQEGDEWAVWSVRLTGPSVLLNGRISKRAQGVERFWGRVESPGWLMDLTREHMPKD